MTLVVCDRVARAMLLLKNAKHIPSLKHIVIIDDITQDLKDKAKKADVNLFSFNNAVVRSHPPFPTLYKHPAKLKRLTVCFVDRRFKNYDEEAAAKTGRLGYDLLHEWDDRLNFVESMWSPIEKT